MPCASWKSLFSATLHTHCDGRRLIRPDTRQFLRRGSLLPVKSLHCRARTVYSNKIPCPDLVASALRDGSATCLQGLQIRFRRLFYMVFQQRNGVADFLHPSDTGGRKAWAEMRRVQAEVAEETPNATLIRNSDLGEWNDIHPLDKKTLGRRVADAIMK